MTLQIYKIASVTVGSSGMVAIDLANIPQGYTDLKLVISGRSNRSSITDDVKIAFNGVSTNQSIRALFGNGATASSATDTLIYGNMNGNNATASTFGSFEIYIPNYAGSTNKSASLDSVNENNGTTAYAYLTAALWSSTAAINQITLTPYTGPNFLQYSTATLYGIL